MSVPGKLVYSILFIFVVNSLCPNENMVYIYYSEVPGSLEIKKQQESIEMMLSIKGIAFDKIDISANKAKQVEMRKKAGDPKALPPQIVSGDRYCGDFDAFKNALETDTLEEFLKP